MALTYPLDLRSSGIRLQRVTFSLVDAVSTAKLPNALQVMEIGPAMWRASITCRPEREYGRRRAAAFVDALRGGKPFLCYSPAQCWPAAHPGGAITGAWADNLAVTGTTATTVTATAPNAALRLRAGDLVDIRASDRFALLRVLADAQPVGGIITIEVAPRVVTSLFGPGSFLWLKQPVCEMVLDPSAEPNMGDGLSMEPVSFQAVQKLS